MTASEYADNFKRYPEFLPGRHAFPIASGPNGDHFQCNVPLLAGAGYTAGGLDTL